MSYAIVEMAPYKGCNYTAPPDQENKGCLVAESRHAPPDYDGPDPLMVTAHAFVPFTEPARVVRVVRHLSDSEAEALL